MAHLWRMASTNQQKLNMELISKRDENRRQARSFCSNKRSRSNVRRTAAGDRVPIISAKESNRHGLMQQPSVYASTYSSPHQRSVLNENNRSQKWTQIRQSIPLRGLRHKEKQFQSQKVVLLHKSWMRMRQWRWPRHPSFEGYARERFFVKMAVPCKHPHWRTYASIGRGEGQNVSLGFNDWLNWPDSRPH